MMKYSGRMDKQCLKLCDALNTIKGIRTEESCCGHGKSSFDVWFTLDKKYFQNLHLIGRITSRNYGFPNWNCIASASDIYRKDKLEFLLSSTIVKGEKAYEQADEMAEHIDFYLGHEKYIKKFKIIK